MKVAERDRERVGGVVRFRNFLQPQHGADHLLNLHLARAAISDERDFHLQRCVLGEFDARLSERENRRSPPLGDSDGRFHVRGKEKFFDGDLIGRVLTNDFNEIAVDFGKSLGNRRF